MGAPSTSLAGGGGLRMAWGWCNLGWWGIVAAGGIRTLESVIVCLPAACTGVRELRRAAVGSPPTSYVV